VHCAHLLVSPTKEYRSPTPKGRQGAASCAHGRRHRRPLTSLSRLPLQWTRLLPRPHVAVSVTPGKTRTLAHQIEWSLLSRRDGFLDRSRNGQVRRSSREERRRRDGVHGQQESTPQRLASARGLRGWPAAVIAGAPDSERRKSSRQQPQRRVSDERRLLRQRAGVACGGALVLGVRSFRPRRLPPSVLCFGVVRTSCSARRRSAAVRRRVAASAASQDETGLADRPTGSRTTTIIHTTTKQERRILSMETWLMVCCHHVVGAKRPISQPRAARRKIPLCSNSTVEDIYPRALWRCWSKTKIKIGKPAISWRSFFHFSRPSSSPRADRTAASAPARQEACESEEFAFCLWWPLRGGVGVLGCNGPQMGLPLWLPFPVYAQS
jgi:hypothetical protein